MLLWRTRAEDAVRWSSIIDDDLKLDLDAMKAKSPAAVAAVNAGKVSLVFGTGIIREIPERMSHEYATPARPKPTRLVSSTFLSTRKIPL